MTDKYPLVTAVITTYKRKPQVFRRALSSIVNQTYPNIEIYVVNDYPDDARLVDNIRKVVSDYTEKRNINYIVVEKNGGACKARNIALDKAEGKYFACLDDDDEWLPNKIELQVNAAEKDNDIALVYCNAIIKNEQSGKEKVLFFSKQPEGMIFKEILAKNNIGSCSYPLIRTECLKKVGGFNESMPALQDWELYLRLLETRKVAYVHQTCAIYYRYHGERISTNPQKRIEAFEKIHANYVSQLGENKTSASSFYLMGTYFYSLAGDMKLAFHYYLMGIKNDPWKLKRNVKDFIRMAGRKFKKNAMV